MRRLPTVSAALTLALVAACGNPDQEGEPAPADSLALAPDTAADTVAVAAPEPVAVGLPIDFPPDFPVPPSSTVVAASTAPDAGGAYSEITIATRGESSESYAWYRQALTDAGWLVSSEGQSDDTRTLHATQGESTVDLTVGPDAERTGGWVRVRASIWKVGT